MSSVSNSLSTSASGGLNVVPASYAPSSTRKPNSNHYGRSIFNPVRRQFKIPVETIDEETYNTVRDAIIRKTLKRPRDHKALKSSNNQLQLAEVTSSSSPSSSTLRISSPRPHDTTKEIEGTIQRLENESKEAKNQLLQAQEQIQMAQKHLVKVIQDREQELNHIEASIPPIPSDLSSLSSTRIDCKELCTMMQEKEDLEQKAKDFEEKLKHMQEQWTKQDKEKEQELNKKIVEKKRKAIEAIEEAEDQMRKKIDVAKKSELEEIRHLEEKLTGIDVELQALVQTKSLMIWLLYEVISLKKKRR